MEHQSNRRRRVRVVALAAGLCLGATGLAPADYDHYRDYDELTRELRRLTDAHPGSATLVSIGETWEGREIWAVEVAGPGPVAASERPALLVVGSLEADRLIGSELALYLVEDLLTRAGTDAAVRDQLATHTFYVVPRANPDGAERMFAPVQSDFRLTLRPGDDDADGRVDEDGPEDLNGDGLITLMRVPEPGGPYMVDPDEPRLLREANPARGERGAYELYREGTNEDGDGFLNEDGPGGVDLNRNFQHAYPYYAPDAGPHMVSEPESRALVDFVLAHRNIAAVLTFGASDNLVGDLGARGEAPAPAPLAMPAFPGVHLEEARGVGMVERPRRFRGGFAFGQQGRATGSAGRPSPSRQPATTVDEADREYYATIAERYRELTGIRTVGNTRAPEGAFHEYAYFQFGVPAFSTPGWGIDAAARAESDEAAAEGDEAAAEGDEAPGEGDEAAGAAEPGEAAGPDAAAPTRAAPRGMPGGMVPAAGRRAGRSPTDGADARVLEWMDEAGVDGFVAWTAYDHPGLGAVEIGGFRPYAATNPPADRIAELGAAHAEFALYLASLFPRVRIAETAVTDHGGGLFEVTAEVENAGYLPTALAQGVTAGAVAPTMVQLDIDPDALVTGDPKTSFLPALDGSGTRESYTWLVRGRRGQEVELRVVAQKGGTDTATLTLR